MINDEQERCLGKTCPLSRNSEVLKWFIAKGSQMTCVIFSISFTDVVTTGSIIFIEI